MKVKFTACGGWGHEQESAKKLLVLGEYYDVDAIVIDKWKTYLTLKNDGCFNHCLFEYDEVLEEIIRTGKYSGNDVTVSLRI